jgi:hypothetical protein
LGFGRSSHERQRIVKRANDAEGRQGPRRQARPQAQALLAKVLDERPPHDEQVTIDRASVAIARLKALLVRIQGDLLRFSESFPDGNILLAECARLAFEGIVCKRPAVQSTGF